MNVLSFSGNREEMELLMTPTGVNEGETCMSTLGGIGVSISIEKLLSFALDGSTEKDEQQETDPIFIASIGPRSLIRERAHVAHTLWANGFNAVILYDPFSVSVSEI